MKLSARSRYATRLLVELARHTGKEPISVTALAKKTGISFQFVEQILKPLKQYGLTTSQRGAFGGHRLALPAEKVTLGQIISLMEGGIQLTACCRDSASDCEQKNTCITRNAWIAASKALEDELKSISLADLAAQQDRGESLESSYSKPKIFSFISHALKKNKISLNISKRRKVIGFRKREAH